MQIGVCKIKLRLPSNQSLKGKRRVIKSLTERIKNHFNVSICEVENQDQWQIATIGIAYVNSETVHIQRTLSKILDFVINQTGEFELLDQQQEIFTGL